MPSSFKAICSDFYVNSKLSVRMDLPAGRETVLELFDRVRRDMPAMRRFKRYSAELAIESPRRSDGFQQWLALRRTSVRAGVVNPDSLAQARALHALTLEIAPFYLTINPIDIRGLEVVFGFDLDAPGNHHAIIHEALYSSGPLAGLIDPERMAPLDVQPVFGMALSARCDVQATFEVKGRTGVREARRENLRRRRADAGASQDSAEGREEPISVFLTVRRIGPVDDVKELPGLFDSLCRQAERLAETRVAPKLITPLREAIASHRY